MRKTIYALMMVLISTQVFGFGFSSGGGGKRYDLTSITGAGTYAAGTTYAKNDLVVYSGSNYVSLQAGNIGHTPDSSGTWWVIFPTGPKGDTGNSGANGATWYTGFDTPAGAGVTGADGDLFFDTSVNAKVYKKTSGTWSEVNSIRGPTGAAGSNGTNGTNGTNGADGAGVSAGVDGTYGVITGINTTYTDALCTSGVACLYPKSDGFYYKINGGAETAISGGVTSTGGSSGQIINTVTTDTTIRNGNLYVVNAAKKLTFRNHSTGRTSVFSNFSTRLIPDAGSKIKWVHPTTFASYTTANGYSVKIPANTWVDIVSYGSPIFQAVLTSQNLVKTGINEYAVVGGGTSISDDFSSTSTYANWTKTADSHASISLVYEAGIATTSDTTTYGGLNILHTTETASTDQTIETTITNEANHTVDPIFKAIDGSNYYFMRLVSSSNQLVLTRTVAGVETTVSNNVMTTSANTRYKIRIITTGSSFNVSIDLNSNGIYDGGETFAYSDSTLTGGKKVGFKFYNYGASPKQGVDFITAN